LAIDPASTRTGGAILGDKTREVMALVEAGGLNVVIVETVGVQSEMTVAGMVDRFLMAAGGAAGGQRRRPLRHHARHCRDG